MTLVNSGATQHKQGTEVVEDVTRLALQQVKIKQHFYFHIKGEMTHHKPFGKTVSILRNLWLICDLTQLAFMCSYQRV